MSVYRDRAPENQAFPYVTVREAISVTPEVAFNQYDDPEGHVVELAQIDVWERWKDPANSGAIQESYTLGDAIAKLCRGARLAAAPNDVSGVEVESGPIRIADVDENLIHKAITVRIRRVLERS